MAQSISGELITHVRLTLDLSLQFAVTGKGARHGKNAYTPHALPAYVLAVAAIEALLSETLLGSFARVLWPKAPLWNLGAASLERWEIRAKVVVVPQMLFGASFVPSSQPFQDFDLLVRIRNDIVHYKMQSGPPKYIQPLTDRGIALTHPGPKGGPDYTWVWKLSCTETIRWAHNSVCALVEELGKFMTAKQRDVTMLSHLARNFQAIDESYVIGWFNKHGIQL